ncbi:MAG: hypothetical protein BGO98_25795 [Myxococcales bacterium 68-20]|nr:MAG: hypothetical protein BGO98_25795 [Myxococcales bacterium 68-20]
MKVPRRLNEESELFAKLVADMKRDRPSPEPLERLLGAINAMPDIEPEPAKLGGKKLFLLASAALLAVGAATLMAQSLPAGAPSAPGVMADTPAPEVVVVVPAPAHEVPSTSVADLPDVPPPAGSFGSRAAAARAVPTAAAASPPSTGQEFEIIVAARRALTGGDHDRCLSLVALYEREFPTGQFALEAKVMRVEATAAGGERSRAAALARELLAREPKNPYEARLRSLLTTIEAQ